MKITFHFDWVKSGEAGPKSFKQKAAYDLFSDYTGRIHPYSPCAVAPMLSRDLPAKARPTVWACDRGTGSKMLSSEDLARRLTQMTTSGVKHLVIVIGGPDGFADKDMMALKPEVRWCFGPLTLPHELAAVVASEQIYRAWTIVKGLPYHQGH